MTGDKISMGCGGMQSLEVFSRRSDLCRGTELAPRIKNGWGLSISRANVWSLSYLMLHRCPHRPSLSALHTAKSHFNPPERLALMSIFLKASVIVLQKVLHSPKTSFTAPCGETMGFTSYWRNCGDVWAIVVAALTESTSRNLLNEFAFFGSFGGDELEGFFFQQRNSGNEFFAACHYTAIVENFVWTFHVLIFCKRTCFSTKKKNIFYFKLKHFFLFLHASFVSNSVFDRLVKSIWRSKKHSNFQCLP